MKRFCSTTFLILFLGLTFSTVAQTAASYQLKYKNSVVYAGIDIGSKGVKLSIIEVGKNAKKSGAFHVLNESSVNTDFISFTAATFSATLNGLVKQYRTAVEEYKIQPAQVFTVISSGVAMQADKEGKKAMMQQLIDSFRQRINEPARQVAVVDVLQEARLSHLGIVPDARRYTTFLIDIGSGNTKGGYFPNGNTNELKLFQLNWGTKSVANATEKRIEDDKSIANFNRQLQRVLAGEASSEIVYAVNASGAYNMSDYVAVSGGIGWAVATLINPEMVENTVVPVTYPEVLQLTERLAKNFESLSDAALVKNLTDNTVDKEAVAREVKRVHSVFDQKALMAGAGLLLKIMRQFEGIYDKKQFFLVKNGQVGWISAYVDQMVTK